MQKVKIGIIICDRYKTCPGGNMEYFEKFITDRYGMKVIYGTHPVPQDYYITHTKLNTWNSKFLQESVKPVLANETIRLRYD
jgi:hypothetical protein